MGAPQTLPANFNGWDQQASAPATLPADFNQWDQPKPDQPSALTRFGHSFLSGLGVTSDADAKNFFQHPINTALNMLDAQGGLAVKAKAAYDKGDYKGAVMYGLNYLVPFIGQQTAAAGEQLNQGDIAGGIGRTLGVAAPIVAGSPAGRAAGSAAVDATAGAADSAMPYVTAPVRYGARAAEALANSKLKPFAQVMTPADEAAASPVRIPGRDFGLSQSTYSGTPLPPTPSPELMQARGLATGAQVPTDPAAGLGQVPMRPQTAAPEATPPPEPMPNTPAGDSFPRTLSGESALRQVLAEQGNTNLLKIAKSRGINVTRESQLKPGTADNLLIDKIVDDFSEDELSNVRDTYLENTRMGAQNLTGLGSEASKTVALQTYFPNLKIPAAQLARTQKVRYGLSDLLQSSH